jgi:IclR family transcriptional regulator, acetate operon repressor
MPDRRPTDLIQSLQRGLRILEWVAAAGRPVTPREVADALDLNLGTAYHLINTLLYEDYLRRDAGRGLVPARSPGGPPACERAVSPASVAVGRALGRAAFAVEDVSLITQLHGGEAVVTAVQEVEAAPNAGRYRVAAAHLPHLTAVGRVMIASRRDCEIPPIVRRVRELAAEREEIFDADQLLSDVEQIRRTGVSFEVAEGEACVAAPIVGAAGEPLGGLALVVEPDRIRPEAAALAQLTRRAAASVGRALAASRSALERLPRA